MIPFVKMQGIGNDFVVVDTLSDELSVDDLPALAREITNRRFGIGGDGLILLEAGQTAPLRMRVFNSDGSESEMCGNGLRVVARLAVDRGHVAPGTFTIETGAGPLSVAAREDGDVEIDMGVAYLNPAEIGMHGIGDDRFLDQVVEATLRGSAVSMGNPHLVIFVDNVDAVALEEVGPRLERHPSFPHRTNVHFAQVLDRGWVRQRTWERGVGVTLACGTGACAVVVAGVENDRLDRATAVDLPGGRLNIRYETDGHVWMTGPAETVYRGRYGAGAVGP